MSYEIKVAETDHGDGFSPEPSVVITAAMDQAKTLRRLATKLRAQS